jgi:hypothetical protein
MIYDISDGTAINPPNPFEIESKNPAYLGIDIISAIIK